MFVLPKSIAFTRHTFFLLCSFLFLALGESANFSQPVINRGGWTPIPTSRSHLLRQTFPIPGEKLKLEASTQQQQVVKQRVDDLPIPVIKPHAHGATLGFNLPDQGLTLFLDVDELADKPFAQNIGLKVITHDKHQAQSSTQPAQAVPVKSNKSRGKSRSKSKNKTAKQQRPRFLASYEGNENVQIETVQNLPSTSPTSSSSSPSSKAYHVGYIRPQDLRNAFANVGIEDTGAAKQKSRQKGRNNYSPPLKSDKYHGNANVKGKTNYGASGSYSVGGGYGYGGGGSSYSPGSYNPPMTDVPQRPGYSPPIEMPTASPSPVLPVQPMMIPMQPMTPLSGPILPRTTATTTTVATTSQTEAFVPSEATTKQSKTSGRKGGGIRRGTTSSPLRQPQIEGNDEIQQTFDEEDDDIESEEGEREGARLKSPADKMKSFKKRKPIGPANSKDDDDDDNGDDNVVIVNSITSTPPSNSRQTASSLRFGSNSIAKSNSRRDQTCSIQTCEQMMTCAPRKEALIDSSLAGVKEIASTLNAEAIFDMFPSLEEQVQNLFDFTSSYTMFLPTNDAIKRLPQNLIDRWTANADEINSVLDNHIVESTHSLDELRVAKLIQPRSAGASLRVSSNGNVSFTVNGQRIVAADQTGPMGGMIHTIDGVLYPASDKNIMETLKACNRFDGFVTLAEGTGFSSTLTTGNVIQLLLYLAKRLAYINNIMTCISLNYIIDSRLNDVCHCCLYASLVQT